MSINEHTGKKQQTSIPSDKYRDNYDNIFKKDKVLKLYEVPARTWVMLVEDGHVPPSHRSMSAGEAVFFDHLDGMYSYCKDINGNVVHLNATQKVIITEPE